MSSWKNNDRDHSKPSWLTEEQKRLCVRTQRGWEIPLSGSETPNTGSATQTELIVAMNMTGAYTNQTSRRSDDIRRVLPAGLTVQDITGDGPYFSTPIMGDHFSLTFQSVADGATMYIPIVFSHPDTSRMYNVSLTDFNRHLTGSVGWTGYTFVPTASAAQATYTTVVPNSLRSSVNNIGPTAPGSGITTNLGFIIVDRNAAGATGTANIAGGTAINLRVIDGDGFSAGITFTVAF